MEGTPKATEHYKSLRQGTEERLQARKDFDLTASELGPALGLGRFHTRLQLYLAKKKGSSPKKEGKGTQKAFEYGRLHEADAAREFQQSCASSGFVLTETGIWPLYYDSFSLGVSLDRLVIDPENEGVVAATYEAKCPVSGKLMNPPHPEYLLQVHAQIQAVGVDEGYLHEWTPERSSYYHVRRDDVHWEAVVKVASYFVVQHLRKGVPPPPTDDETDPSTMKRLLGATVKMLSI